MRFWIRAYDQVLRELPEQEVPDATVDHTLAAERLRLSAWQAFIITVILHFEEHYHDREMEISYTLVKRFAERWWLEHYWNQQVAKQNFFLRHKLMGAFMVWLNRPAIALHVRFVMTSVVDAGWVNCDDVLGAGSIVGMYSLSPRTRRALA